MPRSISLNEEYNAISEYYGDKTAERSGVPLINHIDEGLLILDNIGATDEAKRAYCLHPIFQSDTDLVANKDTAYRFESNIILLTMEYRKSANSYLCSPKTDNWTTIDDLRKYVGFLLPEVRHMLIADKTQNYKDFMLYHYGTHKRSAQLFSYFNLWLNYLGDV